jgi:flagellar protein FlaG
MTSVGSNADSVSVAGTTTSPPSTAPSAQSANPAPSLPNTAAGPNAAQSRQTRDLPPPPNKQDVLETITQVADDIREAIETLNTTLDLGKTKAMISHDADLNRYIVKIADEESGEIIREIPSEAVLKFARNLREIKGLLFDKTT